MKSFNQFLQEAYLSEEDAEQLRLLKRDNKNTYNLRKPIGNRGLATDPTPLPANRRLEPATPEAPKESPGQQVIRQTSNPPTTKALEPGKSGGQLAKPINQIPDAMSQGAYDAARSNPRTGTSSNPTATPSTPSGKPPTGSPPSTSYRNAGLGKENVKVNTPRQQSQSSSSTSNPNIPSRKPGESTRDYATRRQQASQQRMRSTPSSSAIVPTNKPTTSIPTPTPNTPTSPRSTLRGRLFRGGLGALSAVDAVDAAKRGDTKGAIESGLLAAASSNRLNQGAARLGQRAVQGAATRLGMRTAGQVAARFVPGLQTAYGLARGTSALNKGDYLGAALGYGSALPVVGGVAAAADIARDVIDDPNQRYKRIATSGVRSARQIGARSGKFGARYGSAISGSGGPTTVNRKAGTITSGGRTAQLGSTQLIRDPKTGKQVVGDLAYKGGKAVYLARPSVASRDTSLFSQLKRRFNIGGQRDADAAAAKREYRTALANTQRYQKQIRGKR